MGEKNLIHKLEFEEGKLLGGQNQEDDLMAADGETKRSFDDDNIQNAICVTAIGAVESENNVFDANLKLTHEWLKKAICDDQVDRLIAAT